jgi:hypothetical protein
MITREGISHRGAAPISKFDTKLETRDLTFKDRGIAKNNELTGIDLRQFRVQHRLKGAFLFIGHLIKVMRLVRVSLAPGRPSSNLLLRKPVVCVNESFYLGIVALVVIEVSEQQMVLPLGVDAQGNEVSEV